MRIQMRLITLACVLALACPTAALAQSSQEAYGGDNSPVAALDEGSGGGGTGGGSDPGLPFTGGDLGALAGAGGLMLGLGLGMRRLTRRPA